MHHAPVARQTPILDIWYGDRQRFGLRGRPQRFVNILGRVRGNTPIATLQYRLNGQAAQELAVGPDLRRLAGKGDFNIDLALAELSPGENQVEIIATDVEGGETTRTVTVELAEGTCPLPYTVEWSRLAHIQEAAQVVDGRWVITPAGVTPLEIGYDRLIALGDMSWRDFEVTVPITIHGMNASCFNSPSRHSGVGIVLRWQGHSDRGADQWAARRPFFGPEGYGAIAWYCVFHNLGPVLNLFDPEFRRAAYCPAPLDLHVPYVFKARVETTADGGSLYRLKVWPAGEAEPTTWDLSAAGHAKSLTHGSILLGAHHIACSFGTVTVNPPAGE